MNSLFIDILFLPSATELFLPEQEVEKLRDFEEACLELYFREQTRSVSASNEERIRVMANGYVRVNINLWVC